MHISGVCCVCRVADAPVELDGAFAIPQVRATVRGKNLHYAHMRCVRVCVCVYVYVST
jgi:hypothetical protein